MCIDHRKNRLTIFSMVLILYIQERKTGGENTGQSPPEPFQGGTVPPERFRGVRQIVFKFDIFKIGIVKGMV